MAQNIDATAAMFADYTDMTDREAEAYVIREIVGVDRHRAAKQLGDISPNTVDALVQKASEKARLPTVVDVNRQSPNNTGYDEQEAVEVRFENGTQLRYVRLDDGSIHEHIIGYNDPRSILHDAEIDKPSTAGDCIDEYMTVGLEAYFDLDGFEDLAANWDTLAEGIIGHSASSMQ